MEKTFHFIQKSITALACAMVILAGAYAPALASAADTPAYYEIFPASFYDSDGDGMGDLNGIAEKIPYLQQLGVGGVWLMPIHPSPSYHKYDVMDYTAVDSAYGTLEDARSLAKALHEADMTLLLDLVLNHTSSQHPWFVQACQSLGVEPCGSELCQTQPLCRAHSPYVGYYHFSQEAVAGWHTVPGVAGWYYEGVFTPDMPDLNLDSEAVRQELHEICAFWLAVGADGFRLDAVLHYYGEDVEQNNAFLAWLMADLRAMKPDVYVVGEAWKDGGTIARYYDSGISSLFNFPFSGAEGAIVKAIRSGQGAAFARRAAEWQAVWAPHTGASDAPFLSNHDNARIAGTLMKNPDKLKMAASMYLLLPGTPFLYYGEELGMTGSGRDENKRLPMRWTAEDRPGLCLPPAGADQQATVLQSVEEALGDGTSLLRHYQWLLALRGRHPALRTGQLEVLDAGSPALCAYALTQGEDRVVVVHNLGKGAATASIKGKSWDIQELETLVLE